MFIKYKSTELLFKGLNKDLGPSPQLYVFARHTATFLPFAEVAPGCISINPHSKGSKTLLGII